MHVTVNTKNRINSGGFSYDVAGNLSNYSGQTYAYDAENRMTSAAGVGYTYDGDGRRVKKSNGTLYWYGLSGEVLLETNSAGNNPTEYILFQGKRMVRRDSSSSLFYYFEDHLGTSRAIADASGTKCYEADFYPFGGERVITDTCPQNYKFTGKERDSETGLDYFFARHYGSTLGRFLQADPIYATLRRMIDPQELNLYAYVRNTPLRFTDPTGMLLAIHARDEEDARYKYELFLLGLEPADRGSVQFVVGNGRNGCNAGQFCVTADSGHKSNSENFQALQFVANATDTAVMSVVDSTVTISMSVGVREDGKVVLGSYRDIYGHEFHLGGGWWGQTLYQLRGSPVEGITYSVSQNTQVFVSNDQVDVEIVATMHHELRHVFLTDFGKHFPSGKGHHAHEETSNAEKEARKNFRKQ